MYIQMFDEIVSKDDECLAINKQLLSIEKEIMSNLSPEQRAKFLQIDRLNFMLLNRICFLAGANIEQNEQKMSKFLNRFLADFR